MDLPRVLGIAESRAVRRPLLSPSLSPVMSPVSLPPPSPSDPAASPPVDPAIAGMASPVRPPLSMRKGRRPSCLRPVDGCASPITSRPTFDEEFCVAVPDVNSDVVTEILMRLRRAVETCNRRPSPCRSPALDADGEPRCFGASSRNLRVQSSESKLGVESPPASPARQWDTGVAYGPYEMSSMAHITRCAATAAALCLHCVICRYITRVYVGACVLIAR
jgi:hypothetical protein